MYDDKDIEELSANNPFIKFMKDIRINFKEASGTLEFLCESFQWNTKRHDQQKWIDSFAMAINAVKDRMDETFCHDFQSFFYDIEQEEKKEECEFLQELERRQKAKQEKEKCSEKE